MLFNSVTYLTFLTIVVWAFWLMPKRHAKWWVLAASLVFYGYWRIEYLLLIVFSAFVDYFFSLRIYQETHQLKRKLWLLCSLSINLGLLVYFKYTYFIVENIGELGQALGQRWVLSPGEIILPLGISFYTFLSISYTIDVYRRLFDPIRSFPVYLSYVMFWPHMIAGPILRAHELIPQIVKMGGARLEDATEGVKKILIGLFLKVVLADQLSPMVDEAFATSPSALGGLDVGTMAFAFGLQIYFDFAGYSMIAIGSARLLGIHLPENFNWPYLATSPRDFWKRWHITLSAWIRDYLYLPLCGVRFRDTSGGGIDVSKDVKKGGFVRLTFALFLTWFIMGLWHGAAWRFAFWGIWHAALIFAYRMSMRWLPNIRGRFVAVLGWSLTLPLIMLGWIPFRADSLETSLTLMGRMLDFSSYRGMAFRENFYLIVFVVTVGMLAAWFITHARISLLRKPWFRQAGEVIGLSSMVFGIFIFLRPINQFIYFQF